MSDMFPETDDTESSFMRPLWRLSGQTVKAKMAVRYGNKIRKAQREAETLAVRLEKALQVAYQTSNDVKPFGGTVRVCVGSDVWAWLLSAFDGEVHDGRIVLGNNIPVTQERQNIVLSDRYIIRVRIDVPSGLQPD